MVFRPTQRNRDLGKLLKKAREAAGLKQADVARHLDTSQAAVSRYEAGQRELAPADRSALIALCRPEAALTAQIERLSVVTDAETADDVSPNPDFMALQDAEKDVIEIRSAVGEGLPRELQSDQYTLLQYRAEGRATSETQVLRGKRERELLLCRDNPPRYRHLLSESALYRVPGDEDLVREQAAHLLELDERYPQLSLQVVVFDVATLSTFSDMRLLMFADGRKSVVYLPNSTYGQLIKQPKAVAERTRYWDILQQTALSEDNTRKFLHERVCHGRSQRAF